MWQENRAQADLSGAPLESQGGDCFWTVRIPVTFSRLTKDSPGAVQAASDGLALPQACSLLRALRVDRHSSRANTSRNSQL